MSKRLPPVNLIVAMDSRRGIGRSGDLPWRLPKELAYFTRMTTTTKDPKKRNAVVMGRRNWESIPARFRPLKNRLNVVLSRQMEPVTDENVIVERSYEGAMETLDAMADSIETIWNIGGADVYKMGLDSPRLHRLYITFVDGDFGADVFFPEVDLSKFRKEDSDSVAHTEGGITYRFETFTRLALQEL